MKTELMKLHGAFSWNELVTNDVAGAKRFYGELLGWTLTDMETSCGGYTILKTGETELGGIMAIPEVAAGMNPGWFPYITVNDVDSMMASVESLGGKVCVLPQDIPNVGRFMVIQDPQGAMLNLITYLNKA